MEMKSLSEITQNLIINIRDTLPDIDTKEGTFIRDVFINPTSAELSDLYQEIKLVELAQSILTATDIELDKLAMNYFISRKEATKSTGRLRFYLDFTGLDMNETILISQGTLAYTNATANEVEKYYETSTTVEVIPSVRSTYSFDASINRYYVDIQSSSVDAGEQLNTGYGTVVRLGDGIHEAVIGVTNPFSFTGGTDQEDDISLAFRVSLAITGSNIGTKDGYNSYILRQEDVADAKVVGAGDPLMERDNKEGGMVDIYVKSERSEEDKYEFTVTASYLEDTIDQRAFADLLLPKQPVISIISLIGSITVYDENGDEEIQNIFYEDGTSYEVDSSNKYYVDVEWSFIKEDTDLIDDPEELLMAEAKNELITKLLPAKHENDIDGDFLANTTLVTSWSIIDPDLDIGPGGNQNFFRGYGDDGRIYILKSKNNVNNPYVGGRYFIKIDNKIYERVYKNPDYILLKDESIPFYGYSVRAKDVIRWLPSGKKPREHEVLTIKYNWNESIKLLQDGIEEKRVLTADVLVKHSKRVGVEIRLDVVPEITYDPAIVEGSIINRIINYINNIKRLGDSINRSDIVAVVRYTPGVDIVDVEKVFLSRKNELPKKQIDIKGYEYLDIEKIVINMLPAGTIR